MVDRTGGRRYLFARVVGRCLEPQLHDGAVVCADRESRPGAGDIVLAECGGRRVLKRYALFCGRGHLVADGMRAGPIPVDPFTVRILGVVVGCVVDALFT